MFYRGDTKSEAFNFGHQKIGLLNFRNAFDRKYKRPNLLVVNV